MKFFTIKIVLFSDKIYLIKIYKMIYLNYINMNYIFMYYINMKFYSRIYCICNEPKLPKKIPQIRMASGELRKR